MKFILLALFLIAMPCCAQLDEYEQKIMFTIIDMEAQSVQGGKDFVTKVLKRKLNASEILKARLFATILEQGGSQAFCNNYIQNKLDLSDEQEAFIQDLEQLLNQENSLNFLMRKYLPICITIADLKNLMESSDFNEEQIEIIKNFHARYEKDRVFLLKVMKEYLSTHPKFANLNRKEL